MNVKTLNQTLYKSLQPRVGFPTEEGARARQAKRGVAVFFIPGMSAENELMK